jgi:hypothetical protein
VKSALIVSGFCLFIAAVVSYEVMVWRECLDTNSFFYCMRVLSK